MILIYLVVGIILIVLSAWIFLREIKKNSIFKKKGNEKIIFLIKSLLAGENYSFALILFVAGLLFLLSFLRII